MTQSHRADDSAIVAESKFYLPAGSNRSTVLSRLERIWTTVCRNGIETP